MKIKEKILAEFSRNPSFNQSQFARDNGCNRVYVAEVIAAYKRTSSAHHGAGGLSGIKDLRATEPGSPAEEEQAGKMVESSDALEVETRGIHIRTAEGACDYCGVDLKEWRIVKREVSFYDVHMKSSDPDKPMVKRNWRVWVKLERIEENDLEKAIMRFVERIPSFQYAPKLPVVARSKKLRSENLGVMAVMDAHIGKLAWDIETGQGDYDLDISVKKFNYVAEMNLQKMSVMRPEKIIYILGQDMMHYENLEGVTPKGRNILDTDGRLAKLQDAAIDVSVYNILKCRALAPVEVILVQGNHDQTSSLWLARCLRAWFRNDKHVEVDCIPMLRKARLWGNTFIGMAHRVPVGKIPAVHAEFSTGKRTREMWGRATHREILFGDQHKKMQWKVGDLITHGATIFRQLTALSRIDYWHYENMFTDAVPGGEAFVYNKKHGCIANFTEWA